MTRLRLSTHTLATHLVKFQEEEITGVHDVNVLSFISNFEVIDYQFSVNVQFIHCMCSTFYILINFLKLYHNLLHSSITKKAMASGTPSAHVRVPLGDLVFLPPPPPHLCSHYTTWGKNYKGASAEGSRREAGSGVKNIQWRKNYAAAEHFSRAVMGGPKI